MSTISTVGVALCYFALPYGFIYTYGGPFMLLVLSLIFGLVGCIGLLMVFHEKIVGTTTTITVCYAMLNVCSGMLDAATIMPLAETFPRNRGPVVALTKTLTGLGASVLASISSNLLNNNVSAFITFITILLVVVQIFSIALVQLPPYVISTWRRRGKSADELNKFESLKLTYFTTFVPKRRLACGYITVISMIIFFTLTSPLSAYLEISLAGKYVIGTITVFLCLSFLVMALPVS
uniref:Putative zinc metalloprotease NCU04133 n=1 Tax=Lygus hesperus TaxID=30085 RepID=A0A0A9VQU9_LYGHE